MTLSGLALAVGILVDEATVAIENIHTHLAQDKPAGRAVLDAMHEVMHTRFLATMCILAVFIPYVLPPRDRARALPAACARRRLLDDRVARDLVPVLAAWQSKRTATGDKKSIFVRMAERYVGAVECGYDGRRSRRRPGVDTAERVEA